MAFEDIVPIVLIVVSSVSLACMMWAVFGKRV